MKNILAFSGSNSSTSVNQALIKYTASIVTKHKVEVIDLRDFPVPMYSEDVEKADGIPASVQELKSKLQAADGFVLATPEHNSMIPAFFKNTLDWLSRIERNLFDEKPVVLLSTSPGPGGAKFANDFLSNMIPRWGASSFASFKFPSFYDNLKDGEMTPALKEELLEKLKTLD